MAMHLDIISKLREIAKNWVFWLILVTGIAIFLRLLPALSNAAWGCDFGIYYGLTNSFVESGELFNPYQGWGSSYQYFPVLYAITGAAHWITGIDVLIIMPKVAPIFGGLSVMIFYFIVYELVGDRKKALLSSLFLAVLPFHAYQTSQAAPMTIGHFFLMLSMYLFIKNRKNIRYSIPLFSSTILLIMTHHLTTYFYLISIVFIVFVENIRKKEWTQSIKRDSLYILATSGLTFSYWMFIATPVYEGFMNGGLKLGSIQVDSNFTIILFYFMFFSMLGLILLKRRFNLFGDKEKTALKPSPAIFFLTIVISLFVIAVFSSLELPWGKIYFTPMSILYSIPFLVIFSFGVVGFRHAIFTRNGSFICGWFLALVFSFLYGMITLNTTILPHRHLEYIVAPLSIMSVYGMYSILKSDYGFLSKWKLKLLKNQRVVYPVIIVLLVATNAASVYPSYLAWEALDESYETITDENLAVIQWMDENLDRNDTVVASDHRLVLLAAAIGFNTTRDEAITMWNTSNLTECTNELYGVNKNYGMVTHVVVDNIMRESVVHIGFDGKKIYMTNESYEKFVYQPFELVYRNATLNQDMEETHWAEVYAVNWTFIEKYLKEP